MSSFKMPVWVATLDVPFINNKPRSHKPSFDHRPLPTYEEVMQMPRIEKEVLNTPLSKFAPTGIHVGAIILGPDRWLEIGHWVEFMQMPSDELDDQVPKPADESVFENVCLDEIVPEDSWTKWDYDPELDDWEVDYFVKPTPDFNKRTGLPNLIAGNLWRLENSPSYNPNLNNRATPHEISLFNYIHVVVVPIVGTRDLSRSRPRISQPDSHQQHKPHRHRRRYCRRCARRAHTQNTEEKLPVTARLDCAVERNDHTEI